MKLTNTKVASSPYATKATISVSIGAARLTPHRRSNGPHSTVTASTKSGWVGHAAERVVVGEVESATSSLATSGPLVVQERWLEVRLSILVPWQGGGQGG